MNEDVNKAIGHDLSPERYYYKMQFKGRPCIKRIKEKEAGTDFYRIRKL